MVGCYAQVSCPLLMEAPPSEFNKSRLFCGCAQISRFRMAGVSEVWTGDSANLGRASKKKKRHKREREKTTERAPPTSIISSISTLVILPSPSRSYMLKAQLSFCSKLPRDVMDKAQMNSRKSMVPSLFLSKVRKACCANLEASPYGKNCKEKTTGEDEFGAQGGETNFFFPNHLYYNPNPS